MTVRLSLFPLVIACAFLVTATVRGQTEYPSEELSLGTIRFATSGTGEAQDEFLTGVLALHSFWYPEARDRFRKARELDPAFAMAYWGEALTHDHPQWGSQNRRAGAEVLRELDRQLEAGSVDWTDREMEYIEAARVLFHAGLFLRTRRRAYADAMTALAERYEDDDEALAFAALARMSVHGFDKNDPEDVEPVAAELRDLSRRNPEHPGALHYLIHLYDSATFAERGLEAARAYADVAGSASHAVHMPSHIYKRLGMFREMKQANLRAYRVSVEWQERTVRPLRDRDYHAFQWLFDARIALGEYDEARDQLAELERMRSMARSRGEKLGDIRWLLFDFRRKLRRAR